MHGRLKPLAGQVIVVGGAGSGLGLETAQAAAKAGAAVVLAGADEAAVRGVCETIGKAGGRCHPVAADLSTADGCDRVARAAAARFGPIDSWIEASGGEAGLAQAAGALARHMGDRPEPAALVAFGAKVGRAVRTELRQAKGQIAATLIKLPRDWRPGRPSPAAAQAALHAAARPMGQMAVDASGQHLTAATEVKKHPAVLVGVGLLAVAGAALWFNRGRLAQAAVAARPRVARAVRPAVIGLVKRRPVQVAKLVVKHPRPAMKIAKALR